MVSSVSSTDSSAWTALQKTLAAADANGDGVVSEDELASALTSSSTASELISAADEDDDGEISLGEFVSFSEKFSSATGLALLSAQETGSAAAALYADIDSSGNASLSASELTGAASTLASADDFAAWVASVAASSTDSASATSSGSSSYTISDDVKKLLDRIDRNGDGTFNRNDVTEMLLEADGSIKAPASTGTSTDTLLDLLYQVSVAQARAAQEAAASGMATSSDSTSST